MKFECAYCQGQAKRLNPYRGNWECRGCSATAPADFQMGPELELQRKPTMTEMGILHASTCASTGMMSRKTAMTLIGDEESYGDYREPEA